MTKWKKAAFSGAQAFALVLTLAPHALAAEPQTKLGGMTLGTILVIELCVLALIAAADIIVFIVRMGQKKKAAVPTTEPPAYTGSFEQQPQNQDWQPQAPFAQNQFTPSPYPQGGFAQPAYVPAEPMTASFGDSPVPAAVVAEPEQPAPAAFAAEPEQPAPARGEIVYCPNCGAQNLVSSRFCMSCGKELAPQKLNCPVCGAPVKQGQRFCGVCGGKII